MPDPYVIPGRQGGVGTITLNRPKANSYDLAFMKDFDRALDTVLAEEETKVVVVSSALEKFFSAGADIKAFHANTTEANMEMIRFAHQSLRRMGQAPKIFIAAIGGHALGGGLEIALACDLRFAGDGDYQLGLPEVTLGLLPGNGGTQRLPRLIGPAKALQMMITGRKVGPEKALELGIVDCVLPQGNYLRETLDYAARLASGATVAIAQIKRAVHEGMEKPLDEALAMERNMIEMLFDTHDAREGFSAFAEKRRPIYTGR